MLANIETFLGSVPARSSTRPYQALASSGPRRQTFYAAPAERNTKGFRPNDQVPTPTLQSPAIAPQSSTTTQAGTFESLSTVVVTTLTTTQPAEPQTSTPLQDELGGTKADIVKSATTGTDSKAATTSKQPKQASINKSAELDDLYGVSDEEHDYSNTTRPVSERNGLASTAGNHVAHLHSAFTVSTEATKSGTDKSLVSLNQPAPNPQETAKDPQSMMPNNQNKQPNRKGNAFGLDALGWASPGESSERAVSTFTEVTPAPYINFNVLPKYAWNNGVNPKGPRHSRATRQSTGSVLSPALPRSEIQASDLPKSAKEPTLGEAHDHETHTNESPAIYGQRSNGVASTELQSVPAGEEKSASKPSSVSISGHKVTAQNQQPRAKAKEADHYVPPHMRTPKPKPAMTTLSVTPTGSPVVLTPEPQTAVFASTVSPNPRLDPSPVLTSPTPQDNPSSGAATSGKADISNASQAASQNGTVDSPSQPAVKAAEVTKTDHSHLPPHLRPPKVMKPASELKPKAETSLCDLEKASDGFSKEQKPLSTITRSLPQPSTNGNEKATAGAIGVDQDVPSSASVVSRGPTKKTKKVRGMEKLMIEKGYAPAEQAPTRVEGNWMKVEESWEDRAPHDYSAPEHISLTRNWTGQRAQEVREQPVLVDTSAPGFAQGTDVPVGGRLETAISEDTHKTHRMDDPFTEAKADQTAQAAMEAFQKKKQAEAPAKPKLSKKEKQEIRQEWLKRQEGYIKLEKNHPNKPIADIYIRPAEEKDLSDITDIYNSYIENTAIALEISPMTVTMWRARMEDCRDEGFDFFVAVQRSGRGVGHSRRAACEPVCGFTYADDIGGKAHAYRFTAQMQVYVSLGHPRVGIGRCLVDRMMAVLDINHAPRGGVEWRGDQARNQREIKKVIIEVPYWDQVPADVEALEWKTQWLTGEDGKSHMRFEYSGTLKEIGFKQKKT